ncbi:MAG: hypothetical protein CL536_04340 [Alcaligenaceae bacterium]|nr:hypothetical protein [Alcaligenaceae bacterium]
MNIEHYNFSGEQYVLRSDHEKLIAAFQAHNELLLTRLKMKNTCPFCAEPRELGSCQDLPACLYLPAEKEPTPLKNRLLATLPVFMLIAIALCATAFAFVWAMMEPII